MSWYSVTIYGVMFGALIAIVAYKIGYRAAQKYAMEEIRVITSRLHWENREPPHCPGCDCGILEQLIDNAPPPPPLT